MIWTSKNGVILCVKMQFQAKFCKFYVKITANHDLSNAAREARENWVWTIDIEIWYGLKKKGGHWV